MSPALAEVSQAFTADRDRRATFDLRGGPRGEWTDYIHGACRALGLSGVPVGQVNVAVVSEVPAGAGLSSSAALEVATVLAAVACSGARMLDWWERVGPLAHSAEVEFVGVPCGIMDQMASAYATKGHALRIWCDRGERVQVPFDRHILIMDTLAPRSLRASAFGDRVASGRRALEALRGVRPALPALAHATRDDLDAAVMDDEQRRCARHVITENARVEAFVRSLATGESPGPLLLASHRSLRDDYRCSSPPLDWTVDFAMGVPGVEGARMTGAGWGGCVIALGDTDTLADVATRFVPAYRDRWGWEPRTWLTAAEEGADVDWLRDG
jgi:galactokinase